jgi:hypothetical protein
MFATVYILVAGTILLNNMSLISMIPLELRKRRIERAVLTQFGDQLDDDALRELATGPLIQRLRLSANRSDGLDECTREMFCLSMLIRLGKVTERDILESSAAFRRLDAGEKGVLNSGTIIHGMIHNHRKKIQFQRTNSATQLHISSPSFYPQVGGAVGNQMAQMVYQQGGPSNNEYMQGRYDPANESTTTSVFSPYLQADLSGSERNADDGFLSSARPQECPF